MSFLRVPKAGGGGGDGDGGGGGQPPHPVTEILQSRHLFDRLGLPRCPATPADVRKAYRRRALLCHPDKATNPKAKEAL